MAQVIFIKDPNRDEKKKVEFTHSFNPISGWEFENDFGAYEYTRVVYLGECRKDGDMFAAYKDGVIDIWKGHLNSGKY